MRQCRHYTCTFPSVPRTRHVRACGRAAAGERPAASHCECTIAAVREALVRPGVQTTVRNGALAWRGERRARTHLLRKPAGCMRGTSAVAPCASLQMGSTRKRN